MFELQYNQVAHSNSCLEEPPLNPILTNGTLKNILLQDIAPSKAISIYNAIASENEKIPLTKDNCRMLSNLKFWANTDMYKIIEDSQDLRNFLDGLKFSQGSLANENFDLHKTVINNYKY